MAHFYPTVIDDFHGSDGEALVYKALCRLNDEYTVFHSYRWLGVKGKWRSEGEGDFIVIHPRKGILSIEVKSGSIEYRDGRWIQMNRRTGVEKHIDPLGQAAESQYRIYGVLRKKFPYSCPVVGRAAWFTSVIMSDKVPLPLEAVPDIILDQTSLEAPEEALDRAFLYWRQNLGRKQSLGLNTAEYKELLRILMPSFHLAETVASSGRENETSYIQLTNQQFAVLHFLREQPTAAIHGPAGTGKTVMAVEKAKMLADEGKKVLYLCFNEFLLAHLRRHYDNPFITFHNVRSLAEEILGDDSLPISEIIPFFEEFFEHDFDDDTWQYPNVVIDEGQDLNDSLLAHISYLVELQEGCFYVFYDRNQYIMRADKPEWIDQNAECRLVLYRNCRNTSEIASSIGQFVGLKKDYYDNQIHGIQPKASFYRNEAELKQTAEAFVSSMLAQGVKAEDIVILSIHSVPHSALRNVSALQGIPLSHQPQAGHIWFTSVRKFKGLEAQAILLVDGEVSRLAESLTRRLLYVGCSRAKAYLQLAFWEDIAKSEYSSLIQKLTDVPVKGNRKGLLSIFGFDAV
ncbi:NERD domain-containing protein [Megasphaera hexanoica]|nr:NERD domain-containing protein [Megasphaera hexanoica]